MNLGLSDDAIQVYDGDGINPRWVGYFFGDRYANATGDGRGNGFGYGNTIGGGSGYGNGDSLGNGGYANMEVNTNANLSGGGYGDGTDGGGNPGLQE